MAHHTLFLIFFYSIPSFLIAQIIMPRTGSSTASTCSQTFYDPGGITTDLDAASGILTVCPTTPGTYVRITFSSFFSLENTDYLFVYDGAAVNENILGGFSGNSLPPVITATASNPSGCLTFKVASNEQIGWKAVFSCSVSPGTLPVYDNRDCYKSQLICSDATLSGNSNGPGVEELMTNWIPCASEGEKQSSWYYFRMATGGTVGFTIDPDVTIDYDFAIWGPYNLLNCPVNTFHEPIRCSYSAEGGDTGLGNGATDFSEDETGDKWVAELTVNAGEVYVMNINNFSADLSPFNLSWDLRNGATFNCVPLPVGITSFTGKNSRQSNVLEWKTFFEENNDYYIVERSSDGHNFTEIGKVDGAGTSYEMHCYVFTDYQTSVNGYYYRLKQLDFNGDVYHSNIIFLNDKEGLELVSLYPNPANDEIKMVVQSMSETDVSVELVNFLAQVVYSDSQHLLKGQSELAVNIEDLPKGTYLFRITTATGMYHVEKQFIISEK